MPKYKVIARSFRFGRNVHEGDYYGPVIASRDAFFLVIDQTPAEAYLGAVGGLVGALIAMAVSGGVNKQHDVLQFDYRELPRRITEHPDWPIRRKKGPVVVVPRQAVDRIRYAYFGTYDLECGDRVYRIGLKFFGRSAVMKFLNGAGWDAKLAAERTPLAIQLAPLLGIFAGCGLGAITGIALGVPMDGLFCTPMVIGIGACIGLVAGAVISAKVGKM